MKTLNVLALVLVLLCINASTEWPTHTVCKEENLEIYYKSCAYTSLVWFATHTKLTDPQQDFAFSIDRCSDVTTHTFDIRAAMVLRQSIKELYAKVDLIINGKTVLSYSETLCGPGLSKLIFCGKKKGEHLYYEGPITLGIKEIPQGDYTITARLTNEDRATVACADFTVKNYLDY
uniref:Lymphocyte antigen 86 n=1 Tax=Gallus gallus TaxID=9031 RepID=A0A8V0YAR4_CHICK